MPNIQKEIALFPGMQPDVAADKRRIHDMLNLIPSLGNTGVSPVQGASMITRVRDTGGGSGRYVVYVLPASVYSFGFTGHIVVVVPDNDIVTDTGIRFIYAIKEDEVITITEKFSMIENASDEGNGFCISKMGKDIFVTHDGSSPFFALNWNDINYQPGDTFLQPPVYVPTCADSTVAGSNISNGGDYYFYYTFVSGERLVESPPSPISAVYTAGNTNKIRVTIEGYNGNQSIRRLRIYCLPPSIGRAFSIPEVMEVDNPGGSTTTIDFDTSSNDLVSRGLSLNYLDRFPLPATRKSVSMSRAGRAFLYGQTNHAAGGGESVTITNEEKYPLPNLPLRAKVTAASGTPFSQDMIWKTLYVNNLPIGTYFIMNHLVWST